MYTFGVYLMENEEICKRNVTNNLSFLIKLYKDIQCIA